MILKRNELCLVFFFFLKNDFDKIKKVKRQILYQLQKQEIITFIQNQF